jgi:hypothetical protein
MSTSHFARPAQIAGETTAQIATSVRAGCPLQTTNTMPSGRIGWLAPVPIFAALAIASLASAFAQTIPPDAKPTCTVTAAVFKTWFTSGTPVLNGVVNPANSVTFPNTPNCSFYSGRCRTSFGPLRRLRPCMVGAAGSWTRRRSMTFRLPMEAETERLYRTRRVD